MYRTDEKNIHKYHIIIYCNILIVTTNSVYIEYSVSSKSNMSSRKRSGSEDIPAMVQELLKELPKESQTILTVDDDFPNTSKNQIVAEEKFLNNKNTQKSLEDSQNCFDYVFLRKLLQQTPLDCLHINRKHNEIKKRVVVEVSHRSYEEDFLREPKSSERACCKSENCEGLRVTKDKKDGFILREYLLPSQYKKYLQTNELPDLPGLCLLCRRAAVTRMYVNYKSDKDNTGALISDIRNYASIAGEYCLDQCLLPNSQLMTGIFDPVVVHIRKWLVPQRVNGIRYYKQEGYRYPENGLNMPFLE